MMIWTLSWPVGSLCEQPDLGRVGRAFYKDDFLVTNRFSPFWKSNFNDAYPSICWIKPILYLGGMVGYALALPFRILAFVKDLLLLIGALFLAPCLGLELLLKRAIICLGSLAECGSALVGMLCPPLAYRIDEWLQENKTIHEGSWITYWFREVTSDNAPTEVKNEVVTAGHPREEEAFKKALQLAEERGNDVDDESMAYVTELAIVCMLNEGTQSTYFSKEEWDEALAFWSTHQQALDDQDPVQGWILKKGLVEDESSVNVVTKVVELAQNFSTKHRSDWNAIYQKAYQGRKTLE